jgi:hypothetical protein
MLSFHDIPVAVSQETEPWSWTSRQSSIIRAITLKLFAVLSTWQPTNRLILELNAYSPSDSKHWFKNYHFGLEHEGGGYLVQQQEVTTKCHEPNHGWVHGQQVEAPRASAILRLFSPLCWSFPRNLPEAHAVTGLVIRRQLRRQIFPAALRLLWDRLPRLESIVYEPWRVWRRSLKIMYDKGMLLHRTLVELPSNTSIERLCDSRRSTEPRQNSIHF